MDDLPTLYHSRRLRTALVFIHNHNDVQEPITGALTKGSLGAQASIWHVAWLEA